MSKKVKDLPCPGSKIRSKGMGRGMGIGMGKGPIGRMREYDDDDKIDFGIRRMPEEVRGVRKLPKKMDFGVRKLPDKMDFGVRKIGGKK